MIYLESHINVSLPDDAHLSKVDAIGRSFRMKRTIMDAHDHLDDDETKEIVLTGHSQESDTLRDRIAGCVRALRRAGFNVTRYKMEDTVFDSRVEDTLNLLAEPIGG